MEAITEEKSTVSNRDRAAAKQELLDLLLEGSSSEEDLFGPEGVFTKLKGAVMERLLEAEMTEHLGHERQARRKGGNGRNGHSRKTVQTESGPVAIQVPRDREGTFEPQLVKKHQRRLEGFDEKVIALYARGMTTRDIQQHLRELYGTDVSPDLISRATEGVMDEFRAWQSRPLEAVYPIVYLDALFVSVRDGGQVQKRAFYVALGVRVDGSRDVLGLWVAASEGSKFWLSILTELKNRGGPRRLVHLRRRAHRARSSHRGGISESSASNLRRAPHPFRPALRVLERPQADQRLATPRLSR